MRAQVLRAVDGGLIIYVPAEELRTEIYDIPPKTCGCARLSGPNPKLLPLLGAEMQLRPMPPVSVLNDFGLLGLPAKLESMMHGMFRELMPSSVILQLLPELPKQMMSLTKALLPASFDVPDTSGDCYVKKVRFLNVNGQKLFLGFVSKNGKTVLTVQGNNNDAPQYVGTGKVNGHTIAIAVKGLHNPERLLSHIDGLTDIHLVKSDNAKHG